MTIIKQINIKNHIYYFYNDMINIKNFDSNILKIIDKKSCKKVIFTTLDISQNNILIT